MADAVVIGAGAGLSTAAGYTYSGERFQHYFSDLKLIPYCPKCGGPMSMNLRADHTFVQDAGWYEAPDQIADKSICVDGDVGVILTKL